MVYPGSSQSVLSNTDLFSPFLPRVEITRVTLSNTDHGVEFDRNKYESIYDKNPHIDYHPQYNEFGVQQGTRQTYTARQKATEIDALGGNQDLKVTIDLQINTPYDNTPLPSVLNLEAIRAALSIVIIGTNDRNYFTSRLDGYVQGAPGNNASLSVAFPDLDGPNYEVSERGQQVQVYTLSVVFPVSNLDNLDNLGFMAYSQLNPALLTLPTDFVRGEALNFNLQSAFDSLWVLERGSVASTTITKDENGNNQNIPVYKVQDFRTAREIDLLNFDFSITENDIFPNLKKDLRGQRIDINPAKTDFSDIFLSRDINNYCRFFFTFNWEKILIDNSLFGRLFKEAQGSDLQDLMDHTSIKGLKFFRERVQGSGEIGSEPYHKMKPTSLIPDPVRPPKLFKENAIPKLVAQGFDDRTVSAASLNEFGISPPPGPSTPVPFRFINTGPIGIFPDHNGQLGGVIEEKNALASEYVMFGNFDHLRHFSGVDASVGQETDGYFKYRVEIECYDKSIELIDKKHKSLKKHIQLIQTYYTEAIKLERAYVSPPDYSPYIKTDSREEIEYEPGQLMEGAYNPKTKRFNAAFKTRWAPLNNQLVSYLRETVFGSPQDPGFVAILKFFSNKQTTQGRDIWTTNFELKISNALLDYLNPHSATPESISMVLQLMQTVASKIDVMLGVVYKRAFGSVNTVTQSKREVIKRHVAAKNRTFKVEHESADFFNANMEHNLGFDFLYTTNPEAPWANDTGLYEINSDHIVGQANEERNKFFGLTGPLPLPILPVPPFNIRVDLDETHGTYFTPHVILLPTQRLNTVPWPSWQTMQVASTDKMAAVPLDFLKIVSRSLCERKQPTDTAWLMKVLEEGAAAVSRTSAPGIFNPLISIFWGHTANHLDRMSLANDLAAYFALYHDTTIRSANNDILWDGSAAFLGTQIPRDQAVHFYNSSRSYDQMERAAMYSVFMHMAETIIFNEKQQKEIPRSHLNKRNNWTEFYDITDAASAISGESNQLPAGPRLLALINWLKDTPVQVKMLLWKNEIVTPNLSTMFESLVNPTQNDETFDFDPAYQYTTQMINKVEALVGYEVNQKTGELILNKPIWKPMKDMANNIFTWRGTMPDDNSIVLCRSTPYVNEKYLVERNENYNLPTYDKYFIMTK